MTDLPAAMELARANVAANVGAAAGLRVEPLAWGAPLPAALAGPWDVVVAADCLYDVAALPALLRTLGEVSDARTVVYLAYKRRVDAREAPFFADLENLFDRVARRLARDARPLPPSLLGLVEALEEIDMAQLATRHRNRLRLDESLRLGLRLRVLLPLRAARYRHRGLNAGERS